MAFGNKPITKDDLIAAGLDPDKLKDFQEKGVTKDDLTAMEGKLTITVTDLIKSQFAELEGRLTPKPVVKNNNDPDLEEPSDQDLFLTDPAKFVNDKVNKMGSAAAIEIMKTRRQIALDNARTNLKGFKNETLRTEIEKELEKYPAENMARYGQDPAITIQQVHDMIVGRHHDDIVADTNKKEGKFNLIQSGSGGGGTGVVNNSSGPSNKRTLSDSEKEIAKRYGMTEDEWLKADDDMAAEEAGRRKVGV